MPCRTSPCRPRSPSSPTRRSSRPRRSKPRAERDKLMFRVRVKIDPALLRAHPDLVRAGLPGLGYVQLDPNQAWPANAPDQAVANDRSAAALSRASIGLSHRYGSTLALDGVSVEHPGRPRRRPHRPRRGRQVDACWGSSPAPRRSRRGSVTVLGGDMRSRRHRAQVCPRIAYMPQGLGRNIYPDLSVRENIEFFGRLFGQGSRERRERIDDLLDAHGPGALRRPAGQEALRRHAAEAGPLLRADSRPRSAHPRRAHHRRRPLLPAPVLDPHRPDPRPASRHERRWWPPPIWRRRSASIGWWR